MIEPYQPGPRPRTAPTGRLAVAILASNFIVVGCTPAEYGSIDITRSKAIAAEKGIGPQGGAPAAKKARPRGAPNAPAPR